MTPRGGMLLFVVGIAALAAGYALGPASVATSRSSFAPGTRLFPNLAAAAANATKIEITSHGQHLTFTRPSTAADAAWGMDEHGGYPVQPARIHALLTGLAELRVVEPRTGDPALYARLGLNEAGEATEVRVFGAGGAPIAAVDLGHRQGVGAAATTGGTAPETIYVRRPDEAQSWLAEGTVPVDTDGQSWLQRDVLNIDAARITGISVRRGDATLTLAREGDAMKITAPVPPPPADPTKLDETARALDLLTFEDVRRADDGAKVLSVTTYRTKDGLEVTATEIGDDKDSWTRFAASGTGADALKRLAGWDYRLGSFKDRLIAPTADSLKPPPTPQTTSGDQLPGLLRPGAPAMPPPPAPPAPAAK